LGDRHKLEDRHIILDAASDLVTAIEIWVTTVKLGERHELVSAMN